MASLTSFHFYIDVETEFIGLTIAFPLFVGTLVSETQVGFVHHSASNSSEASYSQPCPSGKVFRFIPLLGC